MTSEELKRMVDEWVAEGNEITKIPYDKKAERVGWLYFNELASLGGPEEVLWGRNHDLQLSGGHDLLYRFCDDKNVEFVPGTYIRKRIKGDA